jgi:uncharacterized protein YhbP (UPF0306 family)
MTDHEATTRATIDANLYMTLGTADADGRPWATPVYYAPSGYREFFWLSRPEATHSRNLAARPELGIVIFDSTVPIDTGQGVYMTATAAQLGDAELDPAIEIYSRRSQAHRGRPWTRPDVQRPAALRLYRATVSEHFLLPRGQPYRTPVGL